MSAEMAVNVLVGATLSGSFGNTLGSAIGQIGQLTAAAALIGSAVSGAMDFEHTLMQTGITGGMTDEAIKSLRTTLRDLSVPESTNQSVEQLEKGFNALVSAGMATDKAIDSLHSIGRTATATGASVEDLSKTAYVLVETLGVAPDALSKELDALAYAGKEGAFELKDMAQYFPMLGAGAKNLGLKGSDAVATMAAALQIAKRGAGDPSEAATNMANFTKALTSPNVLKNAKKAGINIKKIMKDAWAKGENPMDAVLDKIKEKTKGDPFKISKIFQDAQVQNFLKPMLADLDDYKQLKKDIASQSMGSVDTDYARMMTTVKEQALGLGNEIANLSDSIGKALLPDTLALIGGLGGLLTTVTNFTEANPELIQMGSHLLVGVGAFMLLGKAGDKAGGAIKGFVGGTSGALGALRNDFTRTLASSRALAASQGTLGSRFKAAGGATGILRSGLAGVRTRATGATRAVRGMGQSLVSLPGRLRGAGIAAGVMRGGIGSLRIGLVGLRVGLRGVGTAIKGLFMSNPLGWLVTAVEFGSQLYEGWEPFRNLVDMIWGKLKAIGSAIAEFFGIDMSFDDSEDADKGKPKTADGDDPEKTAAELEAEDKAEEAKLEAEDKAVMAKVKQPGTAVASTVKNTEDLQKEIAAVTQPSKMEKTFKHLIDVVISAPAGVTATATATGASGTTLTARTGQLMAGGN